VYASILVKNETIRGLLLEAEQKLESNDFKGVMESCTKAFAHIMLEEQRDFYSSDLSRVTSFGVFDRFHDIRFSEIRSFDRANESLIRDINRTIGEIINRSNELLRERADKMNEFADAVKEELAVLRLGIDYRSFKHFDRITPHAYFTMGSNEPKIVGTKRPENYTKENALFCYEFVFELILRLQSLEG
jgi:hypothetical protein